MKKTTNLRRSIIAGALITALSLPSIANACTSLLYKDANGAPYAGRTMELPYQASYFPKGWSFDSDADKHAALSFQAKYAFISLTIPDTKR